ncbi:hypothetical protein LGK95_11520 [Clostridium algoriphilum]|uniref:hypothetical protein n=1 Tax=Clostridium algoriphilum TaxID=198347 RepID=UPI001CF43325|nr:hypothetical protein [Clostridium algoriphilum]MCB2294147.1 hypothetical protein [Clostridium algoriphilum]
MDHREKYTGSKEVFYFFLKDEIIKLFKDKLKIDGHRVLIPDNEELDYEFKLDSDEDYGNFTIKVKWGEKPKQTDDDEFEDNSILAEKFKENTNINSDGMDITTNVSFDYEPFEI